MGIDLSKKTGIRTKCALEKLINLDDIFEFGKHVDKRVEDVIADYPDYIKWCIDTIDGFVLDDEAYRDYDRSLVE